MYKKRNKFTLPDPILIFLLVLLCWLEICNHFAQLALRLKVRRLKIAYNTIYAGARPGYVTPSTLSIVALVEAVILFWSNESVESICPNMLLKRKILWPKVNILFTTLTSLKNWTVLPCYNTSYKHHSIVNDTKMGLEAPHLLCWKQQKSTQGLRIKCKDLNVVSEHVMLRNGVLCNMLWSAIFKRP